MDKDLLLKYLYISYLEARRHKRHTHSQMVFESNLWENLVRLRDDIFDEEYAISPSIYFIQMHPIQREVFAGNFRDRIVHHLVYNIITPYWEKQFIYDAYSCRKWKGTSKWIERISKFMRACSNNYKEEWWILKLDIQWYFMSISRNILWDKNRKVIDNRNEASFFWWKNNNLWRYLITWEFPNYLRKVICDIIYNDPTQKWIFKGQKSDYNWLPPSKSLFNTPDDCWLPIGNLTSQLFSNIYLNDFDHFMKDELNLKYYWRYVDDFVIIHKDKEYLKSLIPQIRGYLQTNLKLRLHPNKVYLQPISHGVQFLGAFIKPYRSYRAKRSVSNFYKCLKECDYMPTEECLNSYLWLFIGYKQYNLIKRIMGNVKFDNMKRISDLVKYYHDDSF